MDQPVELNSPPPPAAAPTPTPAAAPEPPRAAETVTKGKAAAELELEARLEAANKTIKDREMSINDLQDQNFQLKRIMPPVPKPKKKAPFLPTLLHDLED